jgi:hypothetical protein
VAGLLGVGGLGALGTSLAAAAVPTFPDNVVVFPDRDFITVEGYQDHIGETATVEVTRGTTVVGSAQGVVAEGDVAFEINHPGGVCWGNGTALKVTPDIQAGDKATIKFAGTAAGDTTVADAAVGPDHAKLGADGTTVTVTGHLGPNVNPAQLEQRIVNPDLTALVGRRDVRAVPGPLTAAPKGGYSSGLDIAGSSFTATYKFTDPKAAQVAANTGIERLMSWQVEDADANRQGLTIAEFGEAGGPGFGGCPAGPANAAPPQGSYTLTRSTTNAAKLAVNWTAPDPVPGAAAVTGYSVEAIKNADNTLVGARVAPTATGATLTIDAALPLTDYTIEVRSMAGSALGAPFTLAGTTGGDSTPPPGDLTPPALTASPVAGDQAAPATATSVTLTSETAADVYFTTDGSFVLTGDLPSDTAQLYKAPIAITKATEIRAVAIDRAGNISPVVFGFYAPPVGPQPGGLAQPVLNQPAGTDVGKTSVKLSWASVPNATSYQLTAFTDAGAPLPAAQQPGETTNQSQTIGGLAGSTAYKFSLVAINGAGRSPASEVVRAVTAENVGITTAKWKTGDFRVTGTSTAANGTVTVWRANADGSVGAQLGTLEATLTTAVAPATGTTYDWRLRAGVPTTNPGKVFVKSSNGGVAGPFTVANG